MSGLYFLFPCAWDSGIRAGYLRDEVTCLTALFIMSSTSSNRLQRAITAGVNQSLECPKEHREVAAARLPHWKQDASIKLCKAHDDPETGAAGQPTHDHLTTSFRYGYIPWVPTLFELLNNGWRLSDAECQPAP